MCVKSTVKILGRSMEFVALSFLLALNIFFFGYWILPQKHSIGGNAGKSWHEKFGNVEGFNFVLYER